MTTPLWTPSEDRISNAGVTKFRKWLSAYGQDFADSAALHQWSIEDPAAFFDAVWDHFDVVGDKGEGPFLVGDEMMTSRFFPNASLNFAENMLTLGRPDDLDTPAMIFRGEDKADETWTWGDLLSNVSRLQQALKSVGVGPGDRVAAMLPNRPEAIAAMLAAVSLGATWSSASPDFGARAVLDRFGQIEPKVLFAVDGYWYNGKRIEVADKLAEIVNEMPSVAATIVVDYLGEAEAVASTLRGGTDWEDALAGYDAGEIEYTRLPFDHPLYILFSSGTTGAPKCIIHRAGGVLLQHLKEHRFHADVQPGDRLFYFTTLGWMMWNWLVSGLLQGATLLLFDGSPFAPKPEVLFDFAQDTGMTHFGTSAKYIDSLRKADLNPKETHDLSSLRTMLSTGSTLLADSFDYVYSNVKDDIHLASISGGTDIVACFVGGDPTMPVYRGEIQGPGLGMATDVWSARDVPSAAGEKGELVCTVPFPSIPLGFWGDVENAKFKSSYFSKFEGVWCQGDFAERTENGGFIIHGRSDATLNPGGVRIGTAEIYAEVEKFDQVADSVVIGQDWDGDTRVVLFVVMAEGAGPLTDDLIKEIKTAIRKGSSPRHVPALILPVADIPRTKSNKISELAVRDVVHGRGVANTGSLANPEALENFKDIAALKA